MLKRLETRNYNTCTHREAANISKLSLGKRDKYEYLTSEERYLPVKVKWAFEKQT